VIGRADLDRAHLAVRRADATGFTRTAGTSRRAATIRSAAALFVLAIVLSLLASCRKTEPSGLILISIDTLRFDHLGCYGYARETSPEIDRFSQDAILFRQAIAHAPWTLPSHASILTSLLPQQHGALFSSRTPLSPDILTLAEVFQARGFRTAAFTAGGQLDPHFGLTQGFEIYGSSSTSLAESWRRGKTWLGTVGNERFFLFLYITRSTIRTHRNPSSSPSSTGTTTGRSPTTYPPSFWSS